MSTQRDPMWRVKDVLLAEDDDYRYTAATAHPESTVYRIDKRTGRRKVLGPRNTTAYAVKS